VPHIPTGRPSDSATPQRIPPPMPYLTGRCPRAAESVETVERSLKVPCFARNGLSANPCCHVGSMARERPQIWSLSRSAGARSLPRGVCQRVDGAPPPLILWVCMIYEPTLRFGRAKKRAATRIYCSRVIVFQRLNAPLLTSRNSLWSLKARPIR
jgi:hypothetical protein